MIGWVRRLLREPVVVTLTPLTVTHFHHITVELPGYQRELIACLSEPRTVVHELGNATVDDLMDLARNAIRETFKEKQLQAENIAPAVRMTTPPEPEERIARDLKRAKAISRGAAQLLRQAQANGVTLSSEDALNQAADMLHSTLDG